MTVKVSVTVTEIREDGSEGPVEEELAAALAGPVQQFSAMLTWTARQAGRLDHGEREKTVADSGRELQRQVLEAAFALDCAREERTAPLAGAAGIRHGTVEKGHERGVVSIFGPVRAGRMAYRSTREANLYPADARWVLPQDPCSLGMRALVAYHLAEGGYGQAREVIAARTGVTVGRAQLAGIAQDLAGWVDEFYDQRAFGADTDLPGSDVIMMQADGKGIAVRPEHRASGTDAAHPGIKKMAGIVAVADFTPAVRDPGDIAAPPARRKERPGPQARDKWVAASITEAIDSMIGVAFNEPIAFWVSASQRSVDNGCWSSFRRPEAHGQPGRSWGSWKRLQVPMPRRFDHVRVTGWRVRWAYRWPASRPGRGRHRVLRWGLDG